jgi:MarR family transcriptional regulator for hemolysin
MTATRLLKFFKEFSRYHDRCIAPLAAAHDLSMREVHVLLFLANNPEYDTARSISEYRGLSKSQVSQAVDFLSEMDLLHRETDREDRRLIQLSLTPEGRAIAQQAQTLQLACTQELLVGMNEEQMAQMHQLWEIVLANGERLAKEEAL